MEQKYKALDHFIHRDIAGADVLISVGSNIADFNGYIQLNKTAAALWERLQEPCSQEELIQFLQEKYDITRECAGKDVRDFLDELREHEMVAVC